MIFDDQNNGFNGVWQMFNGPAQVPADPQPILPPGDTATIQGSAGNTTTIQGTIGS